MAIRSSGAVARRATRDDLGRVAGLFDAYRQFYDRPPDPGLAARFIQERFDRDESVLFVASAGAAPVAAFCQLYPSFCSVEAGRILVLYDLFVSPGSRGQGLGRALLLAAEDYARAGGFIRMELTTARTNAAAQALYESLGWQRDEVFVAYSRRTAR
jgi:ribosomal protein S18 acetylase RimI-like enzyme